MIDLPAVYDAFTQQRLYRALLEAHSYPGRVIDLAAHLNGEPAFMGVLATLVDQATTLCDAEGVLHEDDWLRLEGQMEQDASDADYVLFKADLAPPDQFMPRLGDVYQPHLGATLILCVDSLVGGAIHFELAGPGIETVQRLSVSGLHSSWFEQRRVWVADYPMGVDIVLCDPMSMVAVPRTTQVRPLVSTEVTG